MKRWQLWHSLKYVMIHVLQLFAGRQGDRTALNKRVRDAGSDFNQLNVVTGTTTVDTTWIFHWWIYYCSWCMMVLWLWKWRKKKWQFFCFNCFNFAKENAVDWLVVLLKLGQYLPGEIRWCCSIRLNNSGCDTMLYCWNCFGTEGRVKTNI